MFEYNTVHLFIYMVSNILGLSSQTPAKNCAPGMHRPENQNFTIFMLPSSLWGCGVYIANIIHCKWYHTYPMGCDNMFILLIMGIIRKQILLS